MKKIKVFLIMFVCIISAIALSACGNEIVSGSIKNGTLNLQVVQGTQIDFSSAIAVLKYEDDSEVEIDTDKLTFSEIDTTTLGEKTLTVTYEEFSFNVIITVVRATITRATISDGTLNYQVTQDEELDTSNVQVTFHYNDGRDVQVNAQDLTFSQIDTSTIGRKRLVISYDGYSFNVNINVVEPEGAPVIISARLVEGTLAEEIKQGTELDTSNVQVVYTYDNESTITVDADSLIFSDFDNQTVSEEGNILTITYGTNTFNVRIRVVSSEPNPYIINMESKLLTEYNDRRTNTSTTETEFYIKDEPIYVGDDNAFNFRITASGIDEETGDLLENIENVKTTKIVEILNNDEYEVLTGDDLTAMVIINDKKNTFDFTETAIGHTFRITVKASNVDEAYGEGATEFTAVVVVVDGFNVYTAKELSVYDNVHAGFNEIKEELGILNLDVNAIILQGDITITKDDVRQDMFYTTEHPNYSTFSALTDQEVAGTPIDTDGDGIYKRVLSANETFTFIGNYFNISLAEFPLMVFESNSTSHYVDVESGSTMTSHLCVFYNTGDLNSATSTMTWKNISFAGNGNVSQDVRVSGGILMMKAYHMNFYGYNTISNYFYINYFFEGGYEGITQEINYTKGYNSYQCLLYFWGANNSFIKNSEYKTANGPAIIADHYRPGKPENRPTRLNIIASTIESIVSGQEDWFKTYNASQMAAQIAGADALFDGTYGFSATDRTLAYDKINNGELTRMNIMIVYKSGDAQGLASAQKLAGYARIFETEEEYQQFLNGEVENYTLDLDKTGADDLAGKAINNTIYLQTSETGTYINQAVDTNGDTNMFLGSLRAITLNTIYKNINPALEIANFNQMTLEAKKVALKQVVAYISANFGGDALTQLYGAGLQYSVFDGSVETFATLSVENKVAEINSQIDMFADAGVGSSRYLTIYTQIGLAATLELYPRAN